MVLEHRAQARTAGWGDLRKQLEGMTALSPAPSATSELLDGHTLAGAVQSLRLGHLTGDRAGAQRVGQGNLLEGVSPVKASMSQGVT